MKVLITSGGTREYIDEVRVLTNISTGKLGATIANTFFLSGKIEHIYYICSKGTIPPLNISDWKDSVGSIDIIHADNVQEVFNVMEKLVPQVDVVIHAMALSDFGFKPSHTKLKSNDPQAFIDSLRDRIIINPKVISFIKKWNPTVKLISFKFEVGKTKEELIDIAYESLIKNNGDFVVANDKVEMKEKGSHIAYIINKDKEIVSCDGKGDIAKQLLKILNL